MKKITGVIGCILYSNNLLWKSCKGSYTSIVLYKVILGILPIVLIWTTQELVNNIVTLVKGKGAFSFVLILFLAQVGIMFITYWLQQLYQLESKKIELFFGETISEVIFEKLQRISYINFESSEFQNKLHRIETAKTQIIKMTNDSLEFIKSFISWVGILVFLISISWWFVPILIVGSIPLIVIDLKFGNRRYQLMAYLTPYGRKESYIHELLSRRESLKEIRLYGAEKLMVKKWKQYFWKNGKENLKLLKSQIKWLMLTQSFFIFTYGISGILVIYLIHIRVILIGSLVAVLQAIQNMQGGLYSISHSISGLYESSFQINELRSFLDMHEDNRYINRRSISDFNSLEVKGLTFTYPDATSPSIKRINLNINSGDKIVIVGTNGSGKSTLIKCLSGLYETKHSLTVNGFPIEEINIKSYQKNISVLFQDFIKYEFTAEENISLGKENQSYNQKNIREAALKVGIHSALMELPNQYDTQLGKLFGQGFDLSGGQWQRIALARSIFRNSNLIILDEPTASLDPKSEVEIIEELFRTFEDKSIVLITHRLGVAQLADKILVMKEGEIIEQGTHNELLNLGGEYKRLFDSHEKLSQMKLKLEGELIG
ncbi:ABC transporter ATP-binding protein [Bacillus sp. APMAM]|uniref:ATP-binding cassette domain-containing protein n=1 Tax=Margalitia sp. FSL K6-0131 TaxID=2954604 RepID=UPI001604741B|nr:ABC transporter ATP-binding protein [Bacillus sp. APMAM]